MTKFEYIMVIFGILLVMFSIVRITTNKQTLHESCKNSYMCPIK